MTISFNRSDPLYNGVDYYVIYNGEGRVMAHGQSRRHVITEAFRKGDGVMLGSGTMKYDTDGEGQLTIHYLKDISNTMLDAQTRRWDDKTWIDYTLQFKRREFRKRMARIVIGGIILGVGGYLVTALIFTW